jgi:hypothetical protein
VKWMTREQVRVGRMGCAWLIRRFIDPAAEFTFAPGSEVMAEAARTGATPFHAEGAELAQRGDLSSFEVMLEHYQLTGDGALTLLGKIVGTADVKGGRWNQPEGPGLKAATEGILVAQPDDAARLEAGAALYDALYAYCQEMVKRGRPNGMFVE